MSTIPTYDGSGANLLNTAQVRENIDEAVIASPEWGVDAQLEADKGLSQILDPPADALGQAYDLLQATLDARDRDAAEGVELDNLGALINVRRRAATYSTVTLTLGGTPATVIAAGKRARVPGTTEIYWALDDPATIGGGGTVDVSGTCAPIGAQEATAASITEIVDAVAGWTTVTNAAAAVAGVEVETDAAYRRRQKASLSAGGTARPASIRAKIEALDAVTAATVIENLTLITDARGIPGKSYRLVVWPTGLSVAQEQEIIEATWAVSPAGIYVDGSERYTVTDDAGFEQEFGFEYGSQVELYAILNLTVTSEYPTPGDADVEAALTLYDNSYTLGSKVLPDDLVDYVREQVPGIDHCDLRIKIGGAPGAGDTVPLYPELDEVPHFDTNVTVNS